MFTSLNSFITKLFNALGKAADMLDNVADAGVSVTSVAKLTAKQYEEESSERLLSQRADRAKTLGITVA